MSRHNFAAAFGQVYSQMPTDQVLAVLGKPDDIRPDKDGDNQEQIWEYGVDHHSGFATLGSIMIDTEENRVAYYYGTRGADDLVSRLGEPRLRHLLSVLARADNGDAIERSQFQPRYAIEAINALQPLGKEVGLAVLWEYLHVRIAGWYDNDLGIILVIRGLFEVPPAPGHISAPQPASTDADPLRVVYPGYFRPPALGVVPDPKNPTEFPRFPLLIIDDIPLVDASTCEMGGVPESAEMQLGYLEHSAGWRTHQLVPTNDPFGTLDKLPQDMLNTPLLAEQLLRLVDTVYRPTHRDFSLMEEKQEMAWFAKVPAAVRVMHVHWNPGKSCYVRADGTTLPPSTEPADGD
jgi:hypothetical protein